MTVPAKYSLTEAHFIIVELEREVERLRWAGNAMSDQVDELTEQRIEANAQIRDLKQLLTDAYRYVENGLMAAAHQAYCQAQQDLLDRYRKEIGK